MRHIETSRRAVSAAFCAVLLAACAPTGTAPATSSPPASPSTASSAPATPSGTAAPASPSDPAASDWKNYTTPDGQLTFAYPAEWSIKDRAAEAAPGGVFVEVLRETGKPIATLRTNMVTGSECVEKYPYSLLDSEELPALAQGGQTPRFVFEGRANPTATGAAASNPLAYGITSAPEPSGPTACPIFHFFTWPPSGAMFGGAYDPFDTTPGNPPQIDTPEGYTETGEYKDIRKMITSLRPAGK